MTGNRRATLLPIDTLCVYQGNDDYGTLTPTAVLNCAGLVLVHNEPDGNWYMGQVEDDGSVVCWAHYGPDLGEAIESL